MSNANQRYLAMFMTVIFSLFFLVKASSLPPSALEENLLSRMSGPQSSFQPPQDIFKKKVVFFSLPYRLFSFLKDNKKIIFLFRAISILSVSCALWVSFLLGRALFPENNYTALLFPGLLALSPIIHDSINIINENSITFLLITLSFYLSFLTINKGSTYALLPLLGLLPFFLMYDVNSLIYYLPIFILTTVFYVTKKIRSSLKFKPNIGIKIISIILFLLVFFLFTTINATAGVLFRNLLNVLPISNVTRLILLLTNTYILIPKSNFANFFGIFFIFIGGSIAATGMVGILFFVFQPLISRFSLRGQIIKDSDTKKLVFDLENKIEKEKRLPTSHLIALVIFSAALLTPFIIGKAGPASFYDLNDLLILALPALGFLIVALNSLRLNGLNLTYNIAVFALIFVRVLTLFIG